EVGQAVEEADERLLHHVLAGAAVAQAALDEGQQAPLVARDQRLPGARVALSNLLDQQAVAVGGHRALRCAGSLSRKRLTGATGRRRRPPGRRRPPAAAAACSSRASPPPAAGSRRRPAAVPPGPPVPAPRTTGAGA